MKFVGDLDVLTFFVAPDLPVAGEAFAEGGGFFGVETRAEPESAFPQFIAAKVNHCFEQGPLLDLAIALAKFRGGLLEESQVMVITEIFGENF